MNAPFCFDHTQSPDLKNQETADDRHKMGHSNLLSEQDIHAMFTHRKGTQPAITCSKLTIETLSPVKLSGINPLQPGVAYLYLLKTSETFRFSDNFRGYN